MNSVFISGLVKGEPQTVKTDGVLRTVAVQDNKNPKEFKVVAPTGDIAEKLRNIPSGKRIILDGRISNEELEPKSGIYQGVIVVRRIITITDAMNGIDVATGTIAGSATCEALRYTQAGSPIANLNIKNVRSFNKKDGEAVSVTTFLNAVAWTEKAQQIQPLIPMVDVQVAATGMLVPSEYASTKHNGAMISKIEVWVDEFSIGGAAASAPAPAPQKPRPQRAPTKGSADGTTEF